MEAVAIRRYAINNNMFVYDKKEHGIHTCPVKSLIHSRTQRRTFVLPEAYNPMEWNSFFYPVRAKSETPIFTNDYTFVKDLVTEQIEYCGLVLGI